MEVFKQRDNKGERWVASRTLVHPLTRDSTGLLLLLMPARPWARSRHPDRHPGSTALACMHAGTAHTRTILFFGEGGPAGRRSEDETCPSAPGGGGQDKNKSRSGAGGRTTAAAGHLGSEEQKDALPRG